MRYKQTWFKYESKLATFISFLQGGLAGFAVLCLIYMIPAFICLIAGTGELVFGILCGVAVGLTILTLIGLIFVDADKVDNFMCRKKRKAKTITPANETEQFFFSLFDLVKKICPEKKEIWQNDFIVYSLFKTKLVFLNILDNNKTNNKTMQDLSFAFDTLSLAMFKKYQPVSVLQNKIETLYHTRMDAYNTVYAKHYDNPLAMSFIRECLDWLLWNCGAVMPYGFNPAIPYGDYYFPKQTPKAVFEDEELKQIDELEFQTLDFLEKNIDNFISNFTKTKK